MTVSVIAKLFQKISENFYTISFEYHRARRHLGCMNVLVYGRVCRPVCVTYIYIYIR